MICMFKLKSKEKNENEVSSNKKKIENILFLIVALVVTIIIINTILKDTSEPSDNDENKVEAYKTLAEVNEDESTDSYNGLEQKLSKILTTIKGVGNVNVFVNYSESNKVVAMYDETTTTNSTEETDSSGGTRDTTSTETQKEVVFSDEEGDKRPVTEKVIMPVIEGAIITAQGASDTNVKSNIISAVEAATGLSIDKIQVFEME